MKSKLRGALINVFIFFYLLGYGIGEPCDNCQYCVRDQGYNHYEDYNFYINKCIVCIKNFVSVNGNCIPKEYIPKSVEVKDCFYYDYNFECLNCRAINYFDNDDIYRECEKYGEDYQGKTNVGRIFYLYIVPIVCGIALIFGGIFLVHYILKKKKEKIDNKENKEEINHKSEEQLLKSNGLKCEFVNKDANSKEEQCLKNGNYKLNCSKHHIICTEHLNELKDIIKESKMDEIEGKCPICNEKVTLVQLIDKCEKCNSIKEVSQKYCEGKCKFCSSCFDTFYAKSTTCPNGHRLIR